MRKIAKSCSGLLLAVLSLVLLFPFGEVHAKTKQGHASVESVKVTASGAMQGEPTVTEVNAQAWQVTLGNLTMPGAYAQFEVVVVNDGTADLTITESHQTDFPAEDLYLDVSVVSGGNTLKPGERITLLVETGWDEASAANFEEKVYGTFSLVLYCEGDSVIVGPDSSDNSSTDKKQNGGNKTVTAVKTAAPKTGDLADLEVWTVMITMAACVLLLAGLVHRRQS